MYLVGEFAPGKSILWHAGASSVSIAGIQLSLANGASEVYATTRQDQKCEFCVKQLGAKAAYNTETTDWSAKVLEATGGKGVDIIVDYIGPATFAGNLNVAARDARIVNLASLSGPKLKTGEMAEPNFTAFVAKRLRIEGSSLRSRDEQYQGRLRDQLHDHALPKFKDGSFKVLIEKVFPWEQIQDAHRLMESNEVGDCSIHILGFVADSYTDQRQNHLHHLVTLHVVCSLARHRSYKLLWRSLSTPSRCFSCCLVDGRRCWLKGQLARPMCGHTAVRCRLHMAV